MKRSQSGGSRALEDGLSLFLCLLPGNHVAMLNKLNALPLLVSSSGFFPTIRPSSYRFYATAHHPSDDLSWPTTSSFTPYELLKQDPGAPYSKNRFYDLVKIYHPDIPCNGHPVCKDISAEVRLQRYRILVAANEILSDPAKRSAYDQFGTGWDNRLPNSPPGAWYPGMREHGPIYANATWEDWERWHNRHRGDQKRIVDQKTFVSFVILLALFGGTVNATWVGQRNATYEQRLREVNDESARFLDGRRENTVSQMKSKDARLQHFLIRRDPSGSGLKDGEEHVYKRVLHPSKAAYAGENPEVTRDQPGSDTRQADRSEGLEAQ